MATLYRKYRPQRFGDLLGQNHIKITLEHEVETGKIAHAYLFCGPRGIGKTTVARVFAKALNCERRTEGSAEVCDECSMCREISAGRSLDVVEIDAASHTGVDNVRENIIAASRIAPSRAKYKVFIIDEVHMLSISAFNALLKILEEPSANVLFILCTTEAHKIPATIISRCQRFDFRRISVSEIVKKLQYIASKENIRIDGEILEAIARRSEGHMRDAESLLGQVISIGGREVTRAEADLVIPRSDLFEVIRLIDYLAKKDAGGAIGLVNKLVDEGVNLKIFLADMIEILRKMMLAKINPALSDKLGLELGESVETKISEAGRDLTVGRIIALMEKFIEARNDLRNNFIIQLPIEIAVMELCLAAQNPAADAAPARGGRAPLSSNSAGGFNKSAIGGGVPSGEEAPSGSGNIPSAPFKGGLTKEAVIAGWNEVLAKIKKYNHSLSFILRVCQPVGINGNQLCLAFKYKFHKDRVGEANIKKMVEKVLHEVYGSPLAIEAVIDENLEITNGNGNGNGEAPLSAKGKEESGGGAGDNLVDNILKTFGGKVVE